MSSHAPETLPVHGRVDQDGRLVAADAALERLQIEAGSGLGRVLALPQLAALARATASLGVPLSRTLFAADHDHDLELFVRADPDGDAVQLTIESWAARPMAPPRLPSGENVADDVPRAALRPDLTLAIDDRLNLTELSLALADLLEVETGAVIGRPLTSLLRLVEESDGSMPLLAAAASRSPVAGQRALPRHGGAGELIVDAEPLFDEQDRFAGFFARLRRMGEKADHSDPLFDESIDDALRSPLARIISAADHIVERGDGPLRSDYANYASDIAAAGRHLLSVIRAMGQGDVAPPQHINLEQLAYDAAGLVQPAADQRGIAIAIGRGETPCAVAGEAHAIVQILVNIVGNAVRYSPDGARVTLSFAREGGDCLLTIADQGPGIAAADQQRIFDRYERVTDTPDGSGLGLAISRRLARAMGGDIRLDSAPGKGARFTLVLPAA